MKHFPKTSIGFQLFTCEIDGEQLDIGVGGNGILVKVEGVDDKAVVKFEDIASMAYTKLQEAEKKEEVDN